MRLDKKYIILIVVIILGIIILILGRFKKDNYKERLISTLEKAGYTIDTGSMYSLKSLEYPLEVCKDATYDCFGEEYYFDTANYKLVKDEILVSDGVVLNFTPTHDFKSDTTTYYYRVNYENGKVVLKGNYKKNSEFTCEVEYSYGIKVFDKENYCSGLKDKMDAFYSYYLLLIDDVDIVNKMKESK